MSATETAEDQSKTTMDDDKGSPKKDGARSNSRDRSRSGSPRSRSLSKRKASRSRSRSRSRGRRRRRSRSKRRSRDRGRSRSRSYDRDDRDDKDDKYYSDGGKKVFVGNMDHYTDEIDLEKVFSRYGRIEDIFVPRNLVERCNRGYGFVTFIDKRDAVDACAEDGMELHGRRIGVNLAKPRAGGDGRPPKCYVPSRDGEGGAMRAWLGTSGGRPRRRRSRSRRRRSYSRDRRYRSYSRDRRNKRSASRSRSRDRRYSRSRSR